MLTVYHLGISQSERIVWLCEELEIPYELQRFDRDPVTKMAPAEYKALSPTGTAPVIRDGSVTLAESGAIMDWIIHRHGNGRLAVSPDKPNYSDYLFWLNFANASLMAMEITKTAFTMSGVAPNKFVEARLDLYYNLVEERLGRSPYLAGDDLTAADIMLAWCLTTHRVFVPKDLSAYPNILAYLQRVGKRPAYQRALAKCEPGFTPLLT